MQFPAPKILPEDIRSTYHLEPNGQFLYRGYLPGTFEDFENEVKLNRFGLHDHDYDYERPTPKTFRILILGDSYVAALSIPLEKTFHKLVETRLQTNDPLHCGSYQVIAIGQGRKSQVDQLEWLHKFGPSYHPDVVLVVFFCGNDIMENSEEILSQSGDFANFYKANVVPRKEAFFNSLFFLPHSRLNGLFAEALTTHYCEHLDLFYKNISKTNLISPELGVYHTPLTPEWERAYSHTGDLILRLRSDAESLGAKFALASLAGPQAIGDLSEDNLWREKDPHFDYSQPDRWVSDWCSSNGIPNCSLGPLLAKAGRRNVYWRHDGHLNVYGNQVVARPLYNFVVHVAQANKSH